MAYADDLRQEVFNPSTAADLIEGVLPITNSTLSTTASSTSSTTFSDLVSNVITISETSDIELDLMTGVSSSVVDAAAGFRILRGSTPITEDYFFTLNSTGTTGRTHFITISFKDRGIAPGAYTYAVQFKRGSVSTTIYCDNKLLQFQALSES